VSVPFDELGEGVFRRRYASLDLNIGVVIGGDGVLVIDTRASHGQAEELRGEIRGLTSLPIQWVVNTHWHWDHTFGNAVFSEAALWGHRRCRDYLIEHGEEAKQVAMEWIGEANRAVIEAVVVRPPEYVVDPDGSIDIGGRSVRMEWLGLGHTDADLVVTVPDAGVVFAGDLLEQGAPPYYGDGYPFAWQDTVNELRSRASGVTVPGHGDLMDADAVAGQCAEIAAVAATCAEGLATGLFDSSRGPYPVETMQSAWERAKLERGIQR
jgi:glyoxylase-like metal-dependent hydrolase (beta-lactamase superfamily II)